MLCAATLVTSSLWRHYCHVPFYKIFACSDQVLASTATLRGLENTASPPNETALLGQTKKYG